MMVQVTKTHVILCLMIFHPTKMKNDSVFGFSTWKQLENILFYSIKSYDHIHKKQIYNQLYSSDKMMVQVTKTLTILCLMMFHSTKMKNDVLFGFSTSKQLENTLL